ncbi:BTAD domain-containing putative transcriptional regulator [Egicoccus sp. AB-alg2]|uniref:ATP-binding protein n=1 Tax=Egicoccus sp. AB-alg2 TaxID=3242693 RepID=UPI00359E9B83
MTAHAPDAPSPEAGGSRAAGFRFQLVGSFAAWRDGHPVPDRDIGSRKGRTLLKLLLVHADDSVRLGHVSELLWGDAPPDHAERNVASLVSRLRAMLGRDAIEGGAGTYRLRTSARLATDLHDAERLAAEARARLAAAQPALAATAARRALGLVGAGTLLPDDEGHWLVPARAALERLRHDLRRLGWDAALALGDAAGARDLARDALAADPLDEVAARTAMRAAHLLGEQADALRTYDDLRTALADELGVDPDVRTRHVHLAILRDERLMVDGDRTTPTPVVGPSPHDASKTVSAGFVGRDHELAVLRRQWEAAIGGRSGLVLVVGEAGIGKTRLAEQLGELVRSTGGRRLHVRCHEAEQSQFVAPLVEVVVQLAGSEPPDRLRELAGPWTGTLVELVPELRPILEPGPYDRASADIERRRAFQAVTDLLGDLARDRPTLLHLDDLHLAGASTLEALHFLARHTIVAPLLMVATIRVEEGAEVLRELHDVAQRLDLGPLPDDAVAALVRAAGAERFAARILSMTRGHTLSVVESLAALAEADDDADEPPLPVTLQAAVLRRVERAGADVEELLRAAAVLGPTFEPGAVAALLDLAVAEAVRRAGRAVHARLLVEDGVRFAFGNDLNREIVYRSIPGPARALHHRRAAALLAGQPEAVARHAHAAGDLPLALESWLDAADDAASQYANRDAERLLTQAIDAGERLDDTIGTARARLARGAVREVQGDYVGAFVDLEVAAELARGSARPDLEAAALRALGGDVIVGLGRPTTDCVPYLEVGLDVAEAARLGTIEVELMGRLAVVWANRTRFDLASDLADRALARARELDDDRALALALDAVKNVTAYTGDLDRLQEVVPALERLLRDTGDLALLQWCLFESAMPPFARGRWRTAELVLDRAFALNRRTGHPWRAFFLAHRSWFRRAQGDYGRAIDDARTAGRAEVSARHPWWTAFAATMLGWVLSDAGAHEEAVDRLQQAVTAVERDGMEGYLLRCVAHLALATWRAGDTEQATRWLTRGERLAAAVRTPPRQAFLHGAHAYAALARVRLARGDLDAAEALLAPVRAPAAAADWHEIVVTDRLLRGRSRHLLGDHEHARRLLDEAHRTAEEVGLLPLAWEARVASGHACTAMGDTDAAVAHAVMADRHLDAIAASVDDAALAARLRQVAQRRAADPTGEPAG